MWSCGVRTANIDAHSSNAPIWKNAAWRLVWALNTLKNEKDEVLIDGFYDDVAPLTEKDLAFLKSIPYNEKELFWKRWRWTALSTASPAPNC